MQIPGLYNISNVIGQPEVSEYMQRSRLMGAFGDITVGFRDFVFIHATGRNDWTSLLSSANRSFFYPSVDASVILSDAIPALKGTTWLNYLKLRGGISKVGNITVGPYQLQNVFIAVQMPIPTARRFRMAASPAISWATHSMTRT